MSNCMCNCRTCGVKPGIRSGLSGVGHFFNLVLVVLTGFLWVLPYLLIWAVSYKTQCTGCGRYAKKM